MCGIIGYAGYRPCKEILVSGLRKLEYRGYDSAGLAWRDNGIVRCVRAVGNLDSLESALAANPYPETVAGATPAAGIGHTRWATHGGVTEHNTHPHEDAGGRVRIVLNGIIENYAELRDQLHRSHGIECVSETDAEIVAQLIGLYYDGDLAEAVGRSLAELNGHYALVAMSGHEAGTLVGVRKECPLILGQGDGENFIASSIAAFRAHTNRVTVLNDDEIVVLHPDKATIIDRDGYSHAPEHTRVDWDDDRCEKEGFDTFMLKEIHEQGTAVAETLANYRTTVNSLRDDLTTSLPAKIVIVGCGTSYHAGLAGKLAIEQWARIPVDVVVASEWRYSNPIISSDTLVLGITQSGETADTLAAMRLARQNGATVLAVTNVTGSQATRDADEILFTRAGLEIGVAATKTFVAQVALLYAFALRLARLRSRPNHRLEMELATLPDRIQTVLDLCREPTIADIARSLTESPFFLYLGRQSGVPAAMEGALKLKEISYIPTDAYPAGEMKHGPIALLSSETPVIAVATDTETLPKLLSNIAEVKARGAKVFAIASETCSDRCQEHADWIFTIPTTDPILQIPLAVIPLQLLAYHLTRAKGLNVDQPRNLAKTVTVE